MLELNETKLLSNIPLSKQKIDKVTSTKSDNSVLCIQLKNEWEGEENGTNKQQVTRIDVERLVTISRDNIPAGRRSPGRPIRRWSDLIRG